MWFLIRSAFWLGIVFSAIKWPADAPTPPNASDIASAATGQIATLCAANPGACLNVARKASELAPTEPPAPKPPRRAAETTPKPRQTPARG